MKKHTVTRTWTTKSGIKKTKTYTYGVGKSRRGKVLVSKSGKLNKKNIQAFKDEINKSTKYTEAEKRSLIADLNIMLKQRQKSNRRLTTTGFVGELESEAVSRMLSNAGYSIEEAATELGVSEADLLDKKNWKDDVFTIGAVAYQFRFNYTGSVFDRI